MTLPGFNAMPAAQCLALLHSFLDVDSWAQGLCEARPYADVAGVLAQSLVAGESMTSEGILGALARHPRIGNGLGDGSREDQWSRREQAGIDTGGRELAAGNAAYEAKFGFIFLIRAAGRSASDVLSALHDRMSNDRDTEIATVRRELLEIAEGRMRAVFAT